LHGTHLQAAIEEITTHTQSESATNLEEGDIEWLDEDDLKVRYKDKPEQLAAVKRNADTFWHKKREVTLYGDIAYHSKSRVESTTALKRELSIQTNTARKKANIKVKPDKTKTQTEAMQMKRWDSPTSKKLRWLRSQPPVSNKKQL